MPFDHLLTDTIYVAKQTGVNIKGEPSFSAPVAIAAAVEEGLTTVSNLDGNEILFASSLCCAVEIEEDDVVWLDPSTVGDPTKGARPNGVGSAKSRLPHARVLYEAFF